MPGPTCIFWAKLTPSSLWDCDRTTTKHREGRVSPAAGAPGEAERRAEHGEVGEHVEVLEALDPRRDGVDTCGRSSLKIKGVASIFGVNVV